MLNELSKLLVGMLLLDGHAECAGAVRSLSAASATGVPGKPPRVRSRQRAGRLERLMLVPVWIATPLMVILAAAVLMRHA